MVWGISDEQSYAANADGQSAISFGRNTRAEGSYSQSFGYLSRTTESTATAFGFAGLSEGYSSFVAGRGNLATGVAEAIFGTSATAWANTSTSQGVPDAGDRIFAVGNGFGNYVTRPTDSDAFNILYSGEVTAPSLTIALIDTETTGRALTTREWVEANSVTYTGATQDLNLGANKIKAATLEVTATPSFADDAAAGVGGLIVGQAYQTTGLGAAPLNVAGILMIKQ